LSQSHPQSSSKLANLLTQAAASQTKELLKAQKFKDAALGSAARAGGVQKKEGGKQQAKLYKEAEKSEEKEQSREEKVVCVGRSVVGGWMAGFVCVCVCECVCTYITCIRLYRERQTESDVDTQAHVRQVAGVATQSLAHSSSSSNGDGDKPIGNNDLASIKEAIQAKEAELNKGLKEDAMQEQQAQQAGMQQLRPKGETESVSSSALPLSAASKLAAAKV